MKRVSVVTIICLVIAAVFFKEFMIYTLFFAPDRSRGQYEILRLSSESNIRGNEEDYYIRYMNSEKILRYSFEREEATEYYIEVPEGQFIKNGGAVVGNQIYYVLSDDTVRRFDCGEQVDEEVLSREDILKIYGEEDMPDSVGVSIKKSERCLLLMINGYDAEEHLYICPIDGDLKKDFTEVNDLFSKEDQTGIEQIVLYQGIRIKRYYDTEKEKYEIIELGEEGNGRALYFFDSRYTIKADQKLVTLYHEWGASDYSYSAEGDARDNKIDCLNEDEYKYARITEDNLTMEKGEIIGLLHVPINLRRDPLNPSQKELKYDVLFRLDPETGENSILYRARNNRTRIIGYQDGVIYLMNNYRIYTKTMESGETKLFLKLPRDTSYKFDWQGDYLIVMRGYEIYGAYKVR